MDTSKTSSSRAEPRTLYVVPTPLGNLEDVTLRALGILGSCDVVAAEDTRRTRKLLDRHAIRSRCLSLHKFNEENAASRIVKMLASGSSVAYVTDSGTPGVSDPGARLVARVRSEGLPVVPLPGPSAPTTAVSASGWEGPFTFEGYVLRRQEARRRQLRRLASMDRAVVLFEAPGRIRTTLRVLAEVAPEHAILLAREMTKLHEQYLCSTASGLLESLPSRVRGEITLVLMPPAGSQATGARPGLDEAAGAALELESRGVRLKSGCRILAGLTGLGASAIYGAALARRR